MNREVVLSTFYLAEGIQHMQKWHPTITVCGTESLILPIHQNMYEFLAAKTAFKIPPTNKSNRPTYCVLKFIGPCILLNLAPKNCKNTTSKNATATIALWIP